MLRGGEKVPESVRTGSTTKLRPAWSLGCSSHWWTKERDALQTLFLTRTSASSLFEKFTIAANRYSRWNGTIQLNISSFIIQYLCLITILLTSFYARLSAQVALCNWHNVQGRETLKDLFIGRIRDVDVQQQLIKAKADLDDTFKLALECEKGSSTSAQFQKLLPHNQHSNAIKFKQEPTFSIQSSRGKQNYPQNQNNRQNSQNIQGNKSCYFCGNPFSPDHRKLCPAREVTCNLSKKRGHFTKCCNSSKRRVNLVHENEEASGPSIDCNFIDAEHDREPQYGILLLETAVRINSIETLKSSGGKSRSLSIQWRSGYSFLYSIVDTGSSVLFLNKRNCVLLLQRNPSIEFRDIPRYPIDTVYVDYNKHPIRLLGSIQIPISSSGWKVDTAQIFISENRTRNLLGLDLQEQLSVVTI